MSEVTCNGYHTRWGPPERPNCSGMPTQVDRYECGNRLLQIFEPVQNRKSILSGEASVHRNVWLTYTGTPARMSSPVDRSVYGLHKVLSRGTAVRSEWRFCLVCRCRAARPSVTYWTRSSRANWWRRCRRRPGPTYGRPVCTTHSTPLPIDWRYGLILTRTTAQCSRGPWPRFSFAHDFYQ